MVSAAFMVMLCFTETEVATSRRCVIVWVC